MTEEMRKDILRRCERFKDTFFRVRIWATSIEMKMPIRFKNGHVLQLYFSQERDKIRVSDYGNIAAHNNLDLSEVKKLCRRHELKLERCDVFDRPDRPYLGIYAIVEPRELNNAVWSIISAMRDSFQLAKQKEYKYE